MPSGDRFSVEEREDGGCDVVLHLHRDSEQSHVAARMVREAITARLDDDRELLHRTLCFAALTAHGDPAATAHVLAAATFVTVTALDQLGLHLETDAAEVWRRIALHLEQNGHTI